MSDLDDFFAKKDKKKKGKSKKFVGTNTAAIAKVLETTSPPQTDPEKTKRDVQSNLPSSASTDDVWLEVEQKKEDLEGLRVRSLRQTDETDERVERKEDVRGNDACEGTTESASASPWHSVATQQPPEPESTDEVEPDTPQATSDSAAVKAGVYIPPYMRKSSGRGASRMGGPGKTWGSGRRGGNAPPDFKSSEAFPTLGEGP